MNARPTSARFVGRERELNRLATALDSAAAGHASSLLVTGAGGMGISRLLDEAQLRLGRLAEPMTVVRGAGTRSRRGDPYAALLAGLAPLLSSMDDAELSWLAGPAAEQLAALVVGLRPRLAALDLLPERPTVVSVERRQAQMLEAVLGVLGRLGERRPVVLMLEDLHLADGATRAAVTFLTRIIREQRLLVIGTYEPGELTRASPFREDLESMEGSPRPPDRLPLGPLGRDELADLIEGIEGERPSASVLLLIAERSSGSPLVAEELVAARRELSRASLTGSLDELVTARLTLRSPECRRVLRLLAPAGGPLTIEQLAEAASAYEQAMNGLPPRSTTAPRRGIGGLDADLTAGLTEAVEAGIVVLAGSATVADGQIATDAVVAFRHELLGRAVALDILPTNRRRHRMALATALAEHPAAAADHWLAAHENERARQAAIEAATQAESVDASADALAHLELALELTTGDPDPHLQTRAAEAAFGAGRPARAAAHAESAIGHLDERRDRLEVARLYERLGRYRRAAGDHEGALASVRRAVEIVPANPPSLDRARALAALAQMNMLEGTFSEAERGAREAIRVCRLLGPDSLEELHALTTLGVALGWGNDPDSGIVLLRDVCERARRLGDRDGYFRADANLTTVLDLLGRREDAIEVAYEGIAEARRIGQEAVYGNLLRGNAADSLFFLGRWEEMRTLTTAALEWSEGDVSRVLSLENLAALEIESNAGELAGSLLGQALLDVETVREAQYSVPAYQAAASFALWRGDLPDARRAADRGWDRVRATEDWSLSSKMAATVLEVDAASAIDARERRDLVTIATARSQASEVLALAQARVTRAAVPTTFGSRREADANLATAAAYRARLDGRDVPSAWDAVARQWAALGNRYQVARARWRQAEAILSAGDEARSARSAARGPLLEATKVAVQLGAGPLLRELIELARRALIALPEQLVASPAWVPVGPGVEGAGSTAGVGALVAAASHGVEAGSPTEIGAPSELVRGFVGEPPPRRADTFGLSAREKEVLALIAQGRTNREIGERLFISQKTVGVHVGNILAKLRVSGRVEAATVAIRLGLTDRRTR